jgi:hypothetical protein
MTSPQGVCCLVRLYLLSSGQISHQPVLKQVNDNEFACVGIFVITLPIMAR